MLFLLVKPVCKFAWLNNVLCESSVKFLTNYWLCCSPVFYNQNQTKPNHIKKKNSTLSWIMQCKQQIIWYLPAVNLELLTRHICITEFWKVGLQHLKLSKINSDEVQIRSSLNISAYCTSQFHNIISPAVEEVTSLTFRPQWRSTACYSCRIRSPLWSPCSAQQPQCSLTSAVPVHELD